MMPGMKTRIRAALAAALLLPAIANAAPDAKKTPKVDAALHRAVPFIADDYPAALAEARVRKLPIFIEAWAPW